MDNGCIQEFIRGIEVNMWALYILTTQLFGKDSGRAVLAVEQVQ